MIVGLLPDREIAALCTPEDWPGVPLLHPFVDHKEGSLSYGLEPFGYTVRLGSTVYRQTTSQGVLVGGKENKEEWRKETISLPYISLRPNELILAETVEAFSMPPDVSGICLGKSTYARLGLLVNATPIEPGWDGTLTLELRNLSPNKQLLLVVGQGIAQVQFIRGAKPDTTYEGLYQHQAGVTLAR